MAKVKPNLDKVVAQAMRKLLREPKPRRKRVKTEADVWYEQMLAEHKAHGAEHLASARAKLEGPGMEYVVRYLKDGQWKTVVGVFTSMPAAKERARELEDRGYRTQIVRSR